MLSDEMEKLWAAESAKEEFHTYEPVFGFVTLRLHGDVPTMMQAPIARKPADLAGADVVYMCSALLKNGPEQLGEVLSGIERWMEEKEYDSVEQLKGSVSHGKAANPTAYARANYLQLLKSWQ